MADKRPKMTKELIIAGLKQAAAEGIDLRAKSINQSRYRRLYANYKKFFKNWEEAISSAGLNWKIIQAKPIGPFLTEIKAAYAQKLDFNEIHICADKNHPLRRLFYTARNYFKGKKFWRDALTKAALPKDFIENNTKGKTLIKNTLTEMHQAGQALNAAALRKNQTYLYNIILDEFDNYDQALAYARFNPLKIRLRKTDYNPHQIILFIIDLFLRGLNLSESRLRKNPDPQIRRYIFIARDHFQNGWSEAIAVAGIDYGLYHSRKPNNSWNKNKVIERIKLLQLSDRPLNDNYIKVFHFDLYRAARKYCGGWKKALAEIGINTETLPLYKLESKKPQARLTKDEIVRQVKELAAQKVNLRPINLINHSVYRKIFCQAMQQFDSWSECLIFCGIDPAPYCTPIQADFDRQVEKYLKSGKNVTLEQKLANMPDLSNFLRQKNI